MGIFNDLVNAIEDALEPPFPFGPFRAYSAEVEDTEDLSILNIREDPVFGPVVRAIESVADERIEALSNQEVRRVIQETPEVQRRLEQAASEADRRTQPMPVEYSTWISIAFEVAKSKGARFETTQEAIQEGEAPTSEAIRVFARIWQDRKDEMVSASEARRIAREEISV